MKLPRRLNVIAAMIEKGETVYDVGCDHGLLDIFLTLYNNCNCTACDIKESAIKGAIANINKYNLESKIKTVVTNGLTGIKLKENSVVVMSGMGSTTMIEILKNKDLSNIKTLILQSNNDQEQLRKKICKLGFTIEDEICVYEKNINYVVIKFVKGNKKYTKKEYKYGPILLKEESIDRNFYYTNLINENLKVAALLPSKYIFKKTKLILEAKYLKKKINYKKNVGPLSE